MNHFNHTTSFIVICVAQGLLCVFFILALLYSWRRQAKAKEKEFLNALIADKERLYQQFSNELHDNISNLVATAIAYTYKLQFGLPPQQQQTSQELLQLLQRIHAETHDIGESMHTNFITDRGLVPAIEQELNRINKQGTLRTKLKVKGFPQKIPNTQKIMIYRIFQEAVMNTLKHAQANHLLLKINYSALGHFEMIVADDGKGFFLQDAQRRKGLGLFSMNTRSQQLQGTLAIHSRLHVGTYIRLSIPNLLPTISAVKKNRAMFNKTETTR